MVVLGTQVRFSLSAVDKIVVQAAVRKFCADSEAASRIRNAIENPSRQTGRIIISHDDGRILIGTLQTAVNRIHAETEGRGQQACQALTALINRINGN